MSNKSFATKRPATKRLFVLCACVFACATPALALDFYTTDNRDFFTALPSRWPSAVSAENTPGSESFLAAHPGVVGTNEADRALIKLRNDFKILPESYTNLFEVLSDMGGICSNDFNDIVRAIKTHGLINTNDAKGTYGMLTNNGVISVEAGYRLVDRFIGSYSTNVPYHGSVVSGGVLSRSDARTLYGSITRRDTITVTNAAALYAVYDAYVERCYELNCGANNDWDESIYGPTARAQFATPTTLQYRATTPSGAIMGLTNMNAIARKLKFDDFYCYRPGWYRSNSAEQFLLSSSVLECEVNGAWRVFDSGYMPNFGWSPQPAWDGTAGSKVESVFWGLKNYFPDNIFNGDYGYWMFSKSFAYANLKPISFRYCEDFWANGGLLGFETTYSNAMARAFGPSCNVYAALATPNKLQSIQPWMSETGRILATADRAYTATRVTTQTLYKWYQWVVSRSGTIDLGNQTWHVDIYSGSYSAHLSSELAVNRSMWDVSEIMTNGTLTVTNRASAHTADAQISDVLVWQDSCVFHGYDAVSSGLPHDITCLDVMYAPFIQGYCNHTNYDTTIDLGVNMPEGMSPYWYINYTGTLGFTYGGSIYDDTYTAGITGEAFKERIYNVKMSTGDVEDMHSYTRDGAAYSIVGSILARDDCLDYCDPYPPGGVYANLVFNWGAQRGIVYDSIDPYVNSFVAEENRRMATISESRWGRYSDPTDYAYIDETEVSPTGWITGGVFNVDMRLAISSNETYVFDIYAGNQAFTMPTIQNLRARSESGSERVLVAGEVPQDYVFATVEASIVPLFSANTDDTPYVAPERDPHAVYADAVIFQRVDLNAKALKLDTD